MKQKAILMLSIVLILNLPVTKADEVEDPKTDLNSKVAALEKKVQQLEEDQNTGKTALPNSLKWLEDLKLSADFRYRYEFIDEDNQDLRHRNRIRARVKIQAKVNDDIDFILRLATGSSGPRSENQTLGESFSNKPVMLDLAYMTWHPSAIAGLSLVAGKVSNPFYKAGGNQMIWHDAVTPEGGALTYKTSPVQGTEICATAGGFWVTESSSFDVGLAGFQAYVNQELTPESQLTLGTTYYDFTNIQGQSDLRSQWDSTAGFYGNSSVGGVYANDYDVFELFGEVWSKVMDLPLCAYGSWVKNLGTASGYDQDEAWLIGAKLNKAKAVGTWQAGYNYREVEADAVVGEFLDDAPFGGTGGQGHLGYITYQLAQNTQVVVKYFDMKRYASPNVDINKFRLEFKIKTK